MVREGERFIIEIDSVYGDDDGNVLYKAKGFNTLVFDERGIRKLRQEKPALFNVDALEDFELACYLLKNGSHFDLPDSLMEEYKEETEGMSYERIRLYIAANEVAKLKAAQLSVLFDD